MNEEDASALKRARTDGKFHEALLDRCENKTIIFMFLSDHFFLQCVGLNGIQLLLDWIDEK